MRKRLLAAALAAMMTLSACGRPAAAKKLEALLSSYSEDVKGARTADEESREQEEDEVEEEAPDAGESKEEPETQIEGEEDGEEKDADSYERGILSENSWESAFWELRFAPPKGLSMLGEEELNSMMGLGENMLADNFSEQQVEYAKMMNVYEMMSSNLTGSANVVVTTEKLLGSGFSAEDYLEAMKQTITSISTISYTILEEGQTIQIGDETYGVMKAMGEGNGMVLYQDYYVRVKGNRALAIAVTYTDDTLELSQEIINCFEAL